MRRYLILLLAIVCAVPLMAQNAKTMPLQVAQARFVMVTTYYGSNITDARISPEDRQAVADVQDAIQKWKHYHLVYEKRNADIIILVHKGPPDVFYVYDARLGRNSAPMWVASMKDGLKPPEIPLVKKFREAVDKALQKKP